MAQGQPESFAERNKIIIFLVAGAIVGLIIFTWFTAGAAGTTQLINSFIKYLIIAIIAGFIIWAVMKFLQKPKVDLVEEDRKAIIDAGILSKPPMVNDLYFTGDKQHGEFRVGKIIGYCQITSYKDIDVIAGLTAGQIDKMKREQGKDPFDLLVKEDCFVFKRYGFPFSLFEQPKVLRTLEDEHGQLIGDVKIYGVSMIKKYGYYWPNRAFLDAVRVDIGVIREVWRGQIHQFLKDSVAIQQRAVGLDSEFKKDMDNKKLLKIPSPMGEESSRRE